MYWKPMTRAADTVVKIHLEGMSDAGVPELASLARSWENPARLTIDTAGFSGGEYDPAERAWIIERTAAEPSLAFAVAASPESPVENLAIIVKGWGEGDASLESDGRGLRRGKDVRIGHRQRLEATDWSSSRRFTRRHRFGSCSRSHADEPKASRRMS
jgi:hypothetical protein